MCSPRQRRALHLGLAVRELDRVADRQVLAARGVIDLHHRAASPQRLVLGQLLHGQDRPAGDVVLVEDLHGLELGLAHGPRLDAAEDLVQPRQARGRLGVVGMRLPAGLADHVADRLPHRRLRDEIDVGVGVLLPALAFEDAARLPAAGVVAGARHGLAERNALAMLAVFRQRPVLQALLVAHLHAGQVQDPVLHGDRHALALAGLGAVIEGRDDAEAEVKAGAASRRSARPSPAADHRGSRWWRRRRPCTGPRSRRPCSPRRARDRSP